MTCENGLANLSRRLASGSPEAVASLHRHWFSRCVGLVRQATGFDEASAMDVTQDCLLKAATAMPVFRNDQEGEAWLRRVLINRSRDRLRSELRRRHQEKVAMSSRGPSSPASDLHQEDLEDLEDRLHRLEAEAADLLRRRFVLGWTLKRIGRELGIGAGAVDGRIRRALSILKGATDVDR